MANNSPLLAGTPSTPTSDLSGSIKTDINHIISMLDSPVAGTTPESKEDDLLATQILDQRALKNVVAYVEVRSHHENRSSCIVRELTQLGAEVVDKFSNEVTHVIFKDGKKATREKAKKKGVHLVSVLWVDSCKRNKCHVAENLFKPVLPDDDGTPISIGRLKKTKSMQPKDFDEEVANSAERGINRRKRRANADKWKLMETPYSPHLPRTVYAGETQPMSPLTLDMSFSPSITVPDTPLSMRRKLAELKRKTANAGDSDLDSTTSSMSADKPMPLHRKLFEANLSGLMSGPGSPETPIISPGGSINSSPTFSKSSRLRSPGFRSSSGSESETPKNKTKKQKHQLFVMDADVTPPAQLIEPTKATRAKATKPKLFEPSIGRRGRKRGKTNDSSSDSNQEGAAGRDKPKKRVRVTTSNVNPKVYEGSAPVETPVGILHTKRSTRRQSIASSTPSKLLDECPVNPSPKRPRGRRSMAVVTSSDLLDSIATKQIQSGANDSGTAQPSCDRTKQSSFRRTKVTHTKPTVQRRRSVRINSSFLLDAVIPEEEEVTSDSHEASTGSLTILPLRTPVNAIMYPPDLDSTADDSLILKPPLRRLKVLKSVSSARKKKPASSDSDSDGPPTAAKVSQKAPIRKFTQSADSPVPCLSHSRKSMEDFHPSQFNIPMSRKLSSSRKVNLDTSEEVTLQDELKRKVRGRPKRSSSTSSEDGTQHVKKQRPKNTLVTTSMPADDRDVVSSVIENLGGYRLTQNVIESTTHVICGEPRRTLNVLYAIMQGCWLVSREWVFESLEANKWLDEDAFEIYDYFPAAQKSRHVRQSCKQDVYTVDIFAEYTNIYVAEQTQPPHHHLVALIKLGGGRVTQCSRKAELCVGTLGRPEQTAVTEQWLLDSITSWRALPYDSYIIKDGRDQREGSPDF